MEGEPTMKDSKVPRREGNRNVLKFLDSMQFGNERAWKTQLTRVRKHFVDKSLKQLTPVDISGSEVNKDVNLIVWNEKDPLVFANSTDHSYDGSLSLFCPVQRQAEKIEFKLAKHVLVTNGITSIKFDEQSNDWIYLSSNDGQVAKYNFVTQQKQGYYSISKKKSMDINYTHNIVVSGDEWGMLHMLSMDLRSINELRLEWTDIHVEFSKMNPNLFVTSSSSRIVKIWDLRFLKHTLNDDAIPPVRSMSPPLSPEASAHALPQPLPFVKFSRIDGSRLLTQDGDGHIEVREGPEWQDVKELKTKCSLERSFCHSSAYFKPDWHPLNDYVIIGGCRCPSRVPKGLSMLDAISGKPGDTIKMTPACSTAVFNPTGEYLATGKNLALISVYTIKQHPNPRVWECAGADVKADRSSTGA